MGKRRGSTPDIRSSFTREASGPVDQGRFPGSRVNASPPTFPGLPSGGAASGTCGGGLAGYSGGTAQASDLLPFYPLTAKGHPDNAHATYHTAAGEARASPKGLAEHRKIPADLPPTHQGFTSALTKGRRVAIPSRCRR